MSAQALSVPRQAWCAERRPSVWLPTTPTGLLRRSVFRKPLLRLVIPATMAIPPRFLPLAQLLVRVSGRPCPASWETGSIRRCASCLIFPKMPLRCGRAASPSTRSLVARAAPTSPKRRRVPRKTASFRPLAHGASATVATRGRSRAAGRCCSPLLVVDFAPRASRRPVTALPRTARRSQRPQKYAGSGAMRPRPTNAAARCQDRRRHHQQARRQSRRRTRRPLCQPRFPLHYRLRAPVSARPWWLTASAFDAGVNVAGRPQAARPATKRRRLHPRAATPCAPRFVLLPS